MAQFLEGKRTTLFAFPAADLSSALYSVTDFGNEHYELIGDGSAALNGMFYFEWSGVISGADASTSYGIRGLCAPTATYDVKTPDALTDDYRLGTWNLGNTGNAAEASLVGGTATSGSFPFYMSIKPLGSAAKTERLCRWVGFRIRVLAGGVPTAGTVSVTADLYRV